MELSELDALREALKEAKEANKVLIKQADDDRQIHAKEINALKSGTLVIERTPIVEIKQTPLLNVHYLARDIERMFYEYTQRGRRISSIDMENYLAYKIRNNSMRSLPTPVPSTETKQIERIIGFNEVEKEIREYYTEQNERLIAKYKETIANTDRLRNSLVNEYKDKEATLLKETQQDIDIIKAEHLEEIRQLVNKHAEEIKYYTKEKTLKETLESLGDKIKKSMFGTKLTKIK